MFETFIVQPLLNILFMIDAALPGSDLGVAILILTLIIRFAMYPLVKKQIHSQRALAAIQPEVEKLKEKYKKDPKKLQAATMELYKEKEFNPFGSCLPLIIQMPFLIGLFSLFRRIGDEAFVRLSGDASIINSVYAFVKDFSFVKDFVATNEAINTMAFGVVDLSRVAASEGALSFQSYYWPAAALAIATGALTFVQSKMMAPKKKVKSDDPMANIGNQLIYIMPVFLVFISLGFPAALSLYWSASTLIGIGQQYYVMHHDVEKLEEGNEGKSARKS